MASSANYNFLDQPVERLANVGPKRATAFEKAGIHTIGDLLYYFPRRYLDRSTVAKIRQLTENCIAVFRQHQTKWWQKDDVPETELEKIRLAYQAVRQAIFEATHNRVLQQLAQPLLILQNLREWQDSEDDTVAELIKTESDILNRLADALATRDAGQARAAVSRFMKLPPEAIEAMRQTPVGEIPKIPISLHSRLFH